MTASADDFALPDAAVERLQDVRQRDGAFFTSNLSVNEFLLVREAGFVPLTQVMGSCIYHVGWQQPPAVSRSGRQLLGGSQSNYQAGEAWELETATDAWNTARRRAITRLAEEARLAGADAVVGVRIEKAQYTWGNDLIEFIATGTAVRSTRFDLGDQPVLSNLSGQDFAKLFAIGWWPVGIAAGSCVSYVTAGRAQQQRLQSLGGLRNQELPDYSRGINTARRGALVRLERDGHALNAHGVVGMKLEQSRRPREVEYGGTRYIDLWVETHAIGTAVVELAEAKDSDMYSAISLSKEPP